MTWYDVSSEYVCLSVGECSCVCVFTNVSRKGSGDTACTILRCC